MAAIWEYGGGDRRGVKRIGEYGGQSGGAMGVWGRSRRG